MDKSTKEKIVKAFKESPATMQTKGRLVGRRLGKFCYCAEGLIAHVLGYKAEPVSMHDPEGDYRFVVDHTVRNSSMIDYLTQRLNLLPGQMMLRVASHKEPMSLVQINDNLELPFKEIGELIEQQWPVTD